MKMILGCLATTILTLMALPASAVMLCPDKAGVYAPDNCDLIWPFEPNPRAIECDDMLTDMNNLIMLRAQQDDLFCWAYWEREMAAEARLKAVMAPPKTAAERDVCKKAFEKWERFRVEAGWAPAAPPADFDAHFGICQANLDTPEAQIRQIVKELTEISAGTAVGWPPDDHNRRAATRRLEGRRLWTSPIRAMTTGCSPKSSPWASSSRRCSAPCSACCPNPS